MPCTYTSRSAAPRHRIGQTFPDLDDRGDYPDVNEVLDSSTHQAWPVTVVRLDSRRTTVTSPGGSTAVCRVGLDRPLAVAAAVGHLLRMEDDAAPEAVHAILVERQALLRYEEQEPPLVFDLFAEPATGEWGSDEDDARIFAQIAGRS